MAVTGRLNFWGDERAVTVAVNTFGRENDELSDAVKITFISCAFTFVGLALSRWMSYREHMATALKVDRAEEKVAEVHLLVNDKMTELLRAVRAESHAEGMAEGRQAGINERQDRTVEVERQEDRAESKAAEKK